MRRNGRIVTYIRRSAGCRLSVNLAHYLRAFDDDDGDDDDDDALFVAQLINNNAIGPYYVPAASNTIEMF